MDSPEPRRARRPLGLKIAILVIGLIVLLVGGFGVLAARRSAALIEEEINARGSQIAQILAEGMPRATHAEFGRTWSILFETPPIEDATGEWAFRRQQVSKSWVGTFEQLRQGGDLLNVVVLENGVPTMAALGSDRFAFDVAGPDAGGVQAGTCRIGESAYAARRFRKPIAGADGKRFGTVDVYMSLASVERARRKTALSMALGGGGAALVGIALSVLVGSSVSRPLRALARDMAVVRTGNFEHRSTVATSDEIGLLAASFNEMTEGLQQSERMRNDLRLAQDIQGKLLPKKLPDVAGYDLAARYRPAGEVSGDYYDVLILPDSRFGIVVGDVSGKGVGAGLIMTMTRALVRMGAQAGLGPKELLERINTVLFQDLKRGAFVTLLYALVEPSEGRVTFASAGHNPVCVWTPLAGRCEEISAPGIALGVAPPDVFGKKTEEESFLLPPDGRLLIYTDGLTEAMNPANEQYGEDRMKEAMEGAAGAGSEEFVSRLMESVDGHRKDAAPWDDITLVALRRLPLPRPAPPPAGYNQKSHGEGLADASEPPGEDSKLKKGILSVKLEQRPGLAGLLKVSGSIDAHTFSDFQEGFQRLEAAGHRWVIVDLTHLEYISSVGLNYFVNRRVDLIQKDGDVVLVNPQPAIAKILKMLGLYEVLRVVGTLQEAWALAAPGPAESA